MENTDENKLTCVSSMQSNVNEKRTISGQDQWNLKEQNTSIMNLQNSEEMNGITTTPVKVFEKLPNTESTNIGDLFNMQLEFAANSSPAMDSLNEKYSNNQKNQSDLTENKTTEDISTSITNANVSTTSDISAVGNESITIPESDQSTQSKNSSIVANASESMMCLNDTVSSVDNNPTTDISGCDSHTTSCDNLCLHNTSQVSVTPQDVSLISISTEENISPTNHVLRSTEDSPTNSIETDDLLQDELIKNNSKLPLNSSELDHVVPKMNMNSRISTSSDVFITDVYKINPNKTPMETIKDPGTPITKEKEITLDHPSDSAESIILFKDIKKLAEASKKLTIDSKSEIKNSEQNQSQNNTKISSESESNVTVSVEKTEKMDSEELEKSPETIKKHLSFNIDVSVIMNPSKENCQIINIACDDHYENSSPVPRLSESSGALGDTSKISPTSVATSHQPYQLRTNRFSHMSTSSSSSIPSSAAALMQRVLRENKKNIPKSSNQSKYTLTEDRINELKEKWLNNIEIWKVLDYIDKNITLLGYTNPSEDNTGKFKQPNDVKSNEKIKTPEKLGLIEEVQTPTPTPTSSKTTKQRQPRGKRKAKVKFVGSDGESPRKRQRKVNTKQTPVKILVESKFTPGDCVFAKWTDRKFYAATLVSRNAYDGKWTVNFFDGDHKILGEELLIKSNEYCMQGQRVYAAHCDSNFTPGIITGHETKNGEIHYIIARDDKGDISIPAKYILITESQARQIRNRMNESTSPNLRHRTPPKKREEIIGDLSSNKRATRSKTRMLMDSPKPSSSGTQHIVKSDSEDDSTDVTDINFDYVPGIEPECQGSYDACTKMKGKTVAGKMRFTRTKTSDVDASVLGPIPVDGSKMFKNMHVLLNCVQPLSKFCDSSISESENSESENYNFSKIPFVKDRLKLQLEMGGATVYTNFDDISPKIWKNTYLISNKPNISAKYVQSLCIGIKLICHDWVIRCCNENKALDIQDLPVGWSMERQRFFYYPDRKTKWPLKKQNILVADSSDKNFYKFWSRICTLAEAHVSKLTRDSNLENVLCVLSESGYRDELVDRVLSHSVPLVSTVWLIQTLIHGEMRNFDKMKEYQAEYVDSD